MRLILLLLLSHAAFAAPLTITHTDRRETHFDIEEALTPAEQARGLMFRTHLPHDKGMLFYFNGSPKPRQFWMKNTYLQLDVIFIDAFGQIVCILENATPKSLTPLRCDKPVKAVLEVNGGTVRMHKIAVGDRVRHPLIRGEK